MSATPPPGRANLAAVAVPLGAMLASQGVISIASQVVPVLAPEIARTLGVNASDVGIYTSITYTAAVASSVLGGGLVQRFGAMRMCQASLLAAGIGLMLAGAGMAGLIASAVAIGIGYGPPTPASSHVLIRVTPAHLRAVVFSLKQTGVPIGGALTGALAPFLLLRIGLVETILVFAAFCLAVAAALQPLRRDMDADRDPGRAIVWGDTFRPMLLVLRDPAIRPIALVSFSFGAMQVCVSAFYVGYLTQSVGLSLEAAGLALSTTWIAGILGRIGWGALADKSGQSRRVLAAIGMLSGLTTLAVTQFTPAWPLLALHAVSALFGATAVGWNGVYLAEIARLAGPAKASEATGGTFFFTFGGVVAAPLLFRALEQSTQSWTSGYLAMGGLVFLSSLALVLPLSRGTRRR